MEKLKIGLVLDDSLDTTDGVQQYVLTLGRWLSSQKHEVHYLVGRTTRTDIPNIHSLSRNIGVRFNGNRMSMPLPGNRRAIRELLAREKFDVLHVQMPYSPFLAGRIIQAAGNKTAVIGTFHVAPNSGLVHLANSLLRLMVARSLRRFDAVLSVSDVARRFAIETFGIESQVVPNTVLLEPFFRATPFAQYKDKQTIMFLGRLVERKGCQYLLHAAADLAARGKLAAQTHKVIICGGGPLEQSLKHFVHTHGLDDLVDFTGRVSEADKPRYLASADIVAYPSTGGESFGIVLLEAMAAARGAVLAGDNPGYASVIGGREEALFDPKDPTQLADKIEALLADPVMRAQARSWQQGYVRQFGVDVVGQQVLKIYMAALHKRSE